MRYIAVVDTETNWNDEVMSIGIAVAEERSLRLSDSRYYILSPEYKIGGMYYSSLKPREEQNYMCCRRSEAMSNILELFVNMGIYKVFAYNAPFDFRHLPELSMLNWYDIMRSAAYRQYNPFIPRSAECCSTGRLKRNYGVEAMTKLISGSPSYSESHNALDDALDELEIMRMLGHPITVYENAKIIK